MRKIIATLGLIVLVSPLFSSAQTIEEIQARIQVLLERLRVLEAQIGAAPAPIPSPTPAPMRGVSCLVLSRTLSLGMSGQDVSYLQRFLASDPTLYASGGVTGYFGQLTEAAVQRFQAKHGIASSGTPPSNGYGAVGPRTRALIQTLSCTPASPTPSPTPSPFPLPSPLPTPTPLPLGQAACVTDDYSLPSGVTRTFYSRSSVAPGSSCEDYEERRTCTNGSLSGSSDYEYTSCSEQEVKDACRLDGVDVGHGLSRAFYSSRSVAYGASCGSISQSRTCEDGVLSGGSSYKYASCSVDAPVCKIDGLTLQNGSSTVFYFTQNVPANEKCSSYAQTRTCNNGSLSGSNVYKYTTCTPVSSNSCVSDNLVVTHGSSAVFYKYRVPPTGELCGAHTLSRTCTNGTLSGSNDFAYASCSNTTSCTLDGLTLAHGSSTLFYRAQSVTFGNTCVATSTTRTCTNGKFSGNDDYKYSSCSVTAPVASLSQNLANALSALESALIALIERLR